MSQTSDIAQVLHDAAGAWKRTREISELSGVDMGRVSALVGYLRNKHLVDGRKGASGEHEYRIADAKAMEQYLEAVARGGRSPRKQDADEEAPAVAGDDGHDDGEGAPRITRSNGAAEHVPAVPTLGDALLGSTAPRPYVAPKCKPIDRHREARAQQDEPTRTTQQPATPGQAERDGEPVPAKEAKPARIGLTWAIDHRGKLILCLGDNAFELLPPQWAPLARFLEPLAGVFA